MFIKEDDDPFQCTKEWNDWRWQMRNRISTIDELIKTFPEVEKNKEQIYEASKKFPFAITPYYASLIKEASYNDPVFSMAVPNVQELYDSKYLSNDPLHEEHDTVVPGLVHRYEDRALLLVTTTCAMYCRHCTRKRVAGKHEHSQQTINIKSAVQYLKEHPQIKDVILSGGDPFTMSTEMLNDILLAISTVESVEVIRIGTRTPVTMPMRINEELCRMLKKYPNIWVNTHFNHPNEMTEASAKACKMLSESGIPIGNQTVLLKGINDNTETIKTLCRTLIKNRVRPYYLFQCDLVQGVEHFRTRVDIGRKIMEELRGHLSGFAIPTFVVDAPEGHGKIPVIPNYILSSNSEKTVLKSFENHIVEYPHP